jgi:PAS domain S-box-containing protein
MKKLLTRALGGLGARRRVAGVGTLLIATFVTIAGLDVWRGRELAIDDGARELETQARIIGEQTARSVHAVDIVLRNVADEFQRGRLATMDAGQLAAFLHNQTIGLVQIDGLSIHPTGADGHPLAPWRDQAGLVVLPAMLSPADGRWVVPLARALQSPSGLAAGTVMARGRIEYFQDFYRDVQPDAGTKIALLHADGSLLARQPPAEQSLGRRFELLEEMRQAQATQQGKALRITSPIDGVERIAALRAVPEYPLVVTVTRDLQAVLAPWRAQARATLVQTLTLGLLAALLLALLLRQLAQGEAVRRSLEVSQERYALAVAGSDDGVWDWDYRSGLAFDSARSRELLALPSGVEVQPIAEQVAALNLHPDDVQRRAEALRAHLAGEAPAYECEYRVRHADGQYRWVRVRAMCIRDAAGRPIRMAGSVSDIDARKRTEEALRLSEERYAIAMTGSDEAHWVWNIRTDELFASAQLRRITGMADDVPLATRTQWVATVPIVEEDRAQLEHKIAEHLAGRTPRMEAEYRIVDARNGEVRWLHSRGQCFRDANGEPERMAGSLVDVTARKHAEQALRESQQRYELAVAGANDGILDWDIVADRLYASDRAMRMVGLEPDPVVPIHTRAQWAALVMPRFHPEDALRLKAELHGSEDNPADAHEGEYRVRGADGEYRWIRFRGRVVRNAEGRAIRWAGSTSDVDALKKTEQALRESQQRYEIAVAGANQGLWDWDMVADTVFFSERAQQLVGNPPGPSLRPRQEWSARGRCHPDDVAGVRRSLSAYLHGASRAWEAEYRLWHAASDSWHWYRDRGVALRDASGKPYRMAGSLEDITDRKLAQQERERLEGQLRQAQKLEAIGTLAGGIAHDFNNILAAILGYGEMAQQGAPEGSALRRHIDAALSAAMRARSLVERILAFSRSGMGERALVHVQSVVGEALDQTAASLPAAITLESDLDCGDAAVLGDATQVHQVVMNLCANAIQAMGAGGRLSVSLRALHLDEPPAVSTGRLPPGEYLRLAVSDTGVGIAPRVLDRIFDPFFTTREIGVGTGLGLSLVHGIVTDLGGGIEVRSQLGAGTTLTVYLPHSGCVAPEAPQPQVVAQGEGQTILLVDDEIALVRLGEEMLAGLGYEPIGFASGLAALDSLRAEPQRYDIVLSDEAMPEMTGSELAREVRRIRADLPVVLMSGYVTPALTARAQDAGVAEVLSKPLVASEIARSLASALQR